MAITKAQQVRQMLKAGGGMLVSPSNDGRRPGYAAAPGSRMGSGEARESRGENVGGGNRDRDKRPLMGKIAQKYSNHVILTNDNPRDEDEMDIINDILSEVKEMEKISINLDRKDAIESSILEMERNHINGVLLIAGKGHENYQEVNDNLYELNDKNIVNSL